MKTSLRTFRLILPILVISTLLTISGSTLAQSPSNTRPTEVLASTKAPTIPDTTEVIVLKAQLEVMQSFTDRMLATVYWALGSLVVVAALLGGFGWFNSRRLHERDIASIRSELKGNLDSEFSEFRRTQETLTSNELTEIRRSNTDDIQKTVKESLITIQSNVHGLTSLFSNMQTKITHNQLQAEAWYWEARGVPDNEFTRYEDLLRLAVKNNDSHDISAHLKKLCSLINNVTLFPHTVTDLVALLNSLPTEYAIHTESLRTALGKVKTY